MRCDPRLGADTRSGRRAARSLGAEPGAVVWLRDYTTAEGLTRGWQTVRVPSQPQNAINDDLAA